MTENEYTIGLENGSFGYNLLSLLTVKPNNKTPVKIIITIKNKHN